MDFKLDAVDRDLLELVRRWYVLDGYLHGYAVSAKDHVFLHRLVAERMIGRAMVRGEEVDHINGDPGDNRRGNLRVVDHATNCQNRQGAMRNSKCGVRGVWFSAAHKKPWKFQGVVNGIVHCASFESIAEAQEYSERFWAERGVVSSTS